MLPCSNYDNSIKGYDYDLSEANRIPDEAGYPRNDEGICFSLHVTGLSWRGSRVSILKTQLERLGIYLLDTDTDGEGLPPLYNGDCDIYLVGIGNSRLEPEDLGGLLRIDSVFNVVGYSNPEIDNLLDEIQSTPIKHERKFFSRKLQLEIRDEIPYINIDDENKYGPTGPCRFRLVHT